ncbi:condensation domain-containing protein, partial [Myxococcus fulvus]
ELTFRELLGRVKESVLGAFGHQEVPFEKLVEALQSTRDTSRAPLVQVAFGLNGPARLPVLPGLSASEVKYEPGMAKFDFALSVREDAEDLTGFWELNTDLFDVSTVERMAAHYQQVLESAVADPEARVGTLPLSGHREVPEKLDVARIQTRRPERVARDSVPEGFIAPRTGFEELVAGVWAPLLGVKHVSAEAHFFEQGGHSLLVMQVASRLRDVVGRDVPVRMLFENPTVSSLARSLETLVRGGPGAERSALVPVPRIGALPQSFAQQRLWFLDRLEPDSPLYNIPLALRLEGALDVGALERAFESLVRRHESLRTTFHQEGQGAVQSIQAAGPVALPVVDLGGVPVMRREQEALRLAIEEGRRPFDLGKGPLLRATLLKLGEREHVLLLVVHHIVADGWSMGVLTKELETLYGAHLRGEAATLPELPVQYADYAVWQREWLRGEVLEAQLSWWRARLAGAPEALEVPTDRSRPKVQSYRGASAPVRFSRELSEKLKRLSRQEGVTLYMTLLAGFQVLLARYTGQW